MWGSSGQAVGILGINSRATHMHYPPQLSPQVTLREGVDNHISYPLFIHVLKSIRNAKGITKTWTKSNRNIETSIHESLTPVYSL